MAPFIARVWRSTLVAGGAAALLLGCPLYEDSCDGQNDCASGYYCSRFSQRCELDVVEVGCRRPDQCGPGETCTPDFTCRPGSCQFHGCVGGFRCDVQDGAHACLPLGAMSDAGDAAAEPRPPGIDASLGPDASGLINDGGSVPDASSSSSGDAAADADASP